MSDNDSFRGFSEGYNVFDVPWDDRKCKGSNLQSVMEERFHLYFGNASIPVEKKIK